MRKILYWICAILMLGALTVGTAAEDTVIEEGETSSEIEEVVTQGVVRIVVDDTAVYEGANFTAEIVLENTVPAISLAFSDFVFDPKNVNFVGAEWILADDVIADVDTENQAAVIAYEEAVDMNGAVLKLSMKAGEVSQDTLCEIGCTAVMEIDGIRTEFAVTVGNVEILDYIRGDTNGDNAVTSADALYLLRYTILPESYPLNGVWFDYTNDGVVNADDAVYLLYHAMLPEKYPIQQDAEDVVEGTGFKSEPEIVDETTIRFKTEDDGEVMYYYTKSETVPSVEDFKSAYSSAGKSYRDTVDVDGSYYETIEYSQTKAQTYPYMVFMFIDDQENEYTPVLIELDATANTGFVIPPYINENAVFFKTEEDGEVWYYFSKDGSAVASSEFEEYYDDVSKSYLYGQVDVTSGKINYFEIDDDVDFEKYPYLVIAFLSEDNDDDDRKFNYPVVLDVEDADISGTGLSVDGVDEKEVSFTTLVDGRVYYYFTDSKPSVSDRNFENRYDAASSSDKHNYSCDEDEEFDVDYDEDDGYKYLVICVEVEDTDGDSVFLNPVIVNLSDYTSTEDDDDDSTTSKTGLSVTDVDIRDHVITLNAGYTGEVTVYLYTDGKSQYEIGAFSVSAGDTVEFDYSKQSAGIKLLTGAGSDVEIVFQLVNSSETYKKVKILVLE